MYRYRTALLAALLLLVPAATALAVGQGRLQATVVDENGEPLEGVDIHVYSEEIAFEKDLTTDKKGRFSLLVVDATRPFVFEFKKDGYRPVREVFKIDAGGVTRHEFVVPSLEAAPVQPSAEEMAAARRGNKAVVTFNEGVAAAQQGDAATAKAKFLEAKEIDPDMPQVHAALSGIYLDEEDYQQAIATAERLLELEPGNLRALQVLYDAHTALGNEAEAKNALDQLSAVEGGGTDAAVRVFNQGAEAARVGDLDMARTFFEQAAELDPELAPAHAALARVYLDLGEHEKSAASAEEALGLDPSLSDLQKVRYEAYRRSGDEEKAKEVFAEMAEADPQGLAQTLYERGREAFNAGNTAQALTAFEQALQADDGFARAHYMLGLCYTNAGESAKAKEHLQRFIELAPDDPEVETAQQMIDYLG